MTKPVTPKPKAAPRPRSAPRLDHDRLHALAMLIEEELPRSVVELQHRLETEEGMKLRFNAGTYEIALAGVKASATSGTAQAMRNWANAARRAIGGKPA